MSLLRDLRDELVKVITDASDEADTVYAEPGTYDPPCWVVGQPARILYNQTLTRGVQVTWPLRYVVGMVDDEDTNDRLLDARDPNNAVLVALQAHRSTLWPRGGLAVATSELPYATGLDGETPKAVAVDFLLTVIT